MYLEQRVEKLEQALVTLLNAMSVQAQCGDGLSDAVQELLYGDGSGSLYHIEMGAEQPRAEQPKAEEIENEPVPVYTLDDVRAKVTEVMKADKSKKAALQALLKSHGADRVSELDESKFAAVIDAIEKGVF